jgi:hypothetical protein
MPFFVLVMFLKAIYEAIRVFRKKNRAAKPEPLCVGCLHAACSMPQMRGVRSPAHTAERCVP